MKKNNTVHILTLTALFTALTVVLGNVIQIPLQSRQFNLGFLPVIIAAYLLGIPSAVATAALGDIIGALLFPTGAFSRDLHSRRLSSGLPTGSCCAVAAVAGRA